MFPRAMTREAMPMRALRTTGRTGQINACLAVRRAMGNLRASPDGGGGSAGAVAASRSCCETGHEASVAAQQQPINDRVHEALAPEQRDLSRECSKPHRGGRADPGLYGSGRRLLPSNPVFSESSARLQNLNKRQREATRWAPSVRAPRGLSPSDNQFS